MVTLHSPAGPNASSGRTTTPLLVILYLFAVVLPIYVHAGPLLLSALRVLLLLTILPLMAKLLIGRYGRLMLPDIFFVLHTLWMIVALAYNNPDRVIQQTGSVGVEFIGGYIISRACIRDRESFLGMVKWLSTIIILLLPFSLLEARTGNPTLINLIRSLPGVGSVAVVYAEPRFGIERVQSTFAHPIHFGLLCSVAFSLAFVSMKSVWSRAKNIFISGIVFCSGLLALSSGAFLALILQIGLILWNWALRRLHWRWWLLVGLFATLYVAIDLLSTRTPIRVFMTYATFSPHTAYWRSIIFEWGMINVWDNPIFGIGLNDWVRPSYMVSGSMDNFWLVLAVRYGIPGMMVLTIGFLAGLFRVMAVSLKGDEQLINIRRAWVFTMVGLSFTLATVHIWTNIYSFVFFIFGAGMWLLSADPNTNSASDDDTTGTDMPPKRPENRYTRFPPKTSTK